MNGEVGGIFRGLDFHDLDISHTYDAYYPRPLTMVDGNGTTTYAYKVAGTNGAGQLASVDGPLSNDTMVYTYDELGRVATRMLNSTGTELTYDVLGRISQLEFPIGSFDYTYVGQTGRRSTVTYPNSQTTTYSYLDDAHDFRLQTIHHKNPSAATLSKFDYTYDTVGNIQTWRQERAGAAAKIYTFGHDAVDQLTSAVLTDTNTMPTILKRQAWAYDQAGNRTVDQTDDAVFSTSHDTLNRLGARAPGGAVVLSGSLNEAGTVTIDGQPATVDASNNFRGTANLIGATTTVTVKAKDASGNETTDQYEVDASGSSTSYTYDANGNLTSDGTKTYFWNAMDQLVEVKEGSTTIATFEYDGKGRRTEKVAAGLTHAYIYDAEDVVEERVSGSSTDTLRFYHGVGIDEPLARKNSSDVVTYYLTDHLGSVVQETSSSGAVSMAREYGPWGELESGASSSGYAFQGREWDSEISMFYFRARYYSAAAGVWASDDPIGFTGGTNFAQFVSNNPLRFLDPFGLCSSEGQNGNPPSGPKPQPPSQLGGFEIFVGLDIDLVGMLGPEIAAGIVINLRSLAQSGVFGSIGGAAGANIGISVNAGVARRGVSGRAANIDLNLKTVSPTFSFDSEGFNGFAIGIGPGIGGSVSDTTTGKYTVSDLVSLIQNASNSFKNASNSIAQGYRRFTDQQYEY